MKNGKFKFIILGFIMGVILSTSVTAFGLIFHNGKIEAFLQDKQVKIVVDGQYVDLPEDMHIINYEDRVYTPVRLVAEQLGADVSWEEARQAIIINPPEPIYIEVEKEKEVKEEEKETTKTSGKYIYSPLPIRRVLKDVSISLTKMEHYYSESHLILDFINRTSEPIMFLKNQTYVEYDGKKYPVIADFTVNGANQDLMLFVNTTSADRDEKDVVFKFPRIPDDVTEAKINIAVEIYDSPFYESENTIVNFEFYIDPSQEDYYNW